MMCEAIPNPGMIKIYTSGCPKNQNKCWNRMGSPPPEGLKNDVLKFRSIINIVMAPASTGRESSNRIVVIRIDHVNKFICSGFWFLFFMKRIVEMKLIDDRIEEAPAV